jgi:hypothetical protein
MFQMQYGDEWRYHRRLTHAALNTDAVKQYEDMQKGHVRDCLSSILERPQDFVKALHLYEPKNIVLLLLTNIRRAVGRITVSVAYGLSNEKTDMVSTFRARVPQSSLSSSMSKQLRRRWTWYRKASFLDGFLLTLCHSVSNILLCLTWKGIDSVLS